MIRPQSQAARLLAVCCGEPRTLRELYERADPAAQEREESWRMAASVLKKHGWARQATPATWPPRWIITPEGEDVLNQLWAKRELASSQLWPSRGRAS